MKKTALRSGNFVGREGGFHVNGLFWVCAISVFLVAVLPDVGTL